MAKENTQHGLRMEYHRTDQSAAHGAPPGRHPARHRRPPQRGARVARTGHDAAGAARRRPDQRQSPPCLRAAGRVCGGGHLHRRGSRGGRLCGALPARRRRRFPHRHPVLVLRGRDHGHGPVAAQGGVGLQRHRAAGSGVPGRRAGGARPEGGAGVRNLRSRRAGRRRHHHPRRRARQDSRLRPRRSGGGDHEGHFLPGDGRRLHGDRRIDRRSRLPGELSRHALRNGGHDRIRAPYRAGNL